MTPTGAPSASSAARYAVLVRHEARRAVKSVLPRVVFLVMPLGLIAFLVRTFRISFLIFGVRGANGSEQAVPGMAVMFGIVILVYFGYTAFDDFGFGMWNRLRVAGVRSSESLAAKATVMLGHEVVHLALVFVAGVVLFHLRVAGSMVGLAAVMIATAVTFVSYAFMAFALSRSNALYNAFCYVGALVLTALGGGLVPFDVLPGWAKAIAPAAPTYWTISACRRIILEGAGLGTALRASAALLGFAVLFLLIGLWRYDANTDREAFNM